LFSSIDCDTSSVLNKRAVDVDVIEVCSRGVGEYMSMRPTASTGKHNLMVS